MPRTKGSTNKPKVIPDKSITADPVLNPDLDTDVQNVQIEQSSKQKKNTFICERCKCETENFLIPIDTGVLTHIASYHRESPKVFRLCRGCCNELSEVVDKWYLEKGKGKFQI